MMRPSMSVDRVAAPSTSFETRSLDEARAFYAARYVPITAELAHRRVPFAWRARQQTVGSISVMSSAFQGGLRAGAAPGESLYSFLRPVARGAEFTYASKIVNLVPG